MRDVDGLNDFVSGRLMAPWGHVEYQVCVNITYFGELHHEILRGRISVYFETCH